MWGRKKAVEEPVDVDEVFDDLYAELDDIVGTADEPEAEVPVDFEARVNELTVLLREAQERAAQARLAVKPEGLSPFKTPFESKPAAVVERPRSLNRRITSVEVEAGESRIVSQFEDNEPEDKKVSPAVWNLGYRLDELAEAVANILMDQDWEHGHDSEYAGIVHSHPEYEGGGSDTGPHNHEGVYQPVGDYAEAEHDHDTSHDHEGEYQPVGDYSTTDHKHPEYEGQGGDAGPHDHDAVYQPKGSYADADHEHDPQDLTHDHDGTYAPAHDHPYSLTDHEHDAPDLTHDHDGTYAPAHDHPYAASEHEHSDLVERIAKLELDVTLLDVRVRELEPPPPPPPAEGDEYVFTWGSSIRPGGDFSQKINKVDENGEEFGNPESFDTLRYRATLKDGTPYDRTYVVGNVNDYSTFQTYYGRPNVDLDLADGAEVLVTWKKAKLWEDEVLQFTHMKEINPPFGVCGVDSGSVAKFIRMHKSDLNGNAPMNVAEGKQVVLMGNGVSARIPITGVNIDGDKQYFDLLLAEWGPSIANGVELTVAVV